MNLQLITDVTQDDQSNTCVKGDLLLTHGQVTLTPDLKSFVVQLLATRFDYFLGEWFLNTDEGIDYYNLVFEKGNSIENIRALFREVLTTAYGVASITSLTTKNDQVSRTITTVFQVQLADGTTLDSSEVGPFIIGAQQL